MTMEAEIEVPQLKAKECLELPEAGRVKEASFPIDFEECTALSKP